MSRACRVVANVAACLARELTGEALLQKSHLAQVGSIWFVLVRVISWIVLLFWTNGTIHEITRTNQDPRCHEITPEAKSAETQKHTLC